MALWSQQRRDESALRAPVRGDGPRHYERALALAKERIGAVMPSALDGEPAREWRELALIKSRMAGGYWLRSAAQGVCAETSICEHCHNYCSEPAMLAVLSAERASTPEPSPTTPSAAAGTTTPVVTQHS